VIFKQLEHFTSMTNTQDKMRAQGDDPRNLRETVDTLFEGRLELYQSRTGYRFSLDAVLLAYFANPRRGDTVVDLGAGNGVIALILAYLHPSLKITAIELQTSLLEYACRNVRLNRRDRRVKIISGDVRAIEGIVKAASYDMVVCNPPFRKPSSGRVSPDEERKIARHEICGTLDDFLRAGRYLLPAKGRMALIYPAVRSVDLLESMRQAEIEPKRLRMVHSYADTEASLVLVQGVKGGRSGIQIMAPLAVYEKAKRYSAEVGRMLARSEADKETRR
jgi:tRNA1Val (adenine37-N6)-methyltransferase